MARRRFRFQVGSWEAVLERRELLAHVEVAAPPARETLPSGSHGIAPQDFHHAYVRDSAQRLQVSADMTVRINDAFQAFVQNALGIPVARQGAAPGGPGVVPVGTVPMPPTLAGFIDQLDRQVGNALSTIVLTTDRVSPSVRREPKFSPRASNALIPFARAQIAELGLVLAAHPPAFDSQGVATNAAPLMSAVNAAFNNILNAVAENSVHPALFRSPDDFYINPRARFTIPFTGAPASRAPNVFLLGAHGIPLPGTPGRLRH